MSAAKQAQLDAAVSVLEADGGVAAPTTSGRLDGRWRLMYTSRPGSASPIQRTFTGTEAFKIFQDVQLVGGLSCRVDNVVEFGQDARVGILKVQAEASTDSRPLQGFTPRQRQGLALFGKSEVGPPRKENMRINFQFDKAAFEFRKLPFKVPYPVPFRILGDETKGWIDITYLSKEGTLRLTRGNKGTLFVLTKTTDVEELLAAAREKEDDRIKSIVAKLEGKSPCAAPARDDAALGRWRLVWAEQSSDANPFQRALVGKATSWQIITPGALENQVPLGPVTIRALARCDPSSDFRSTVVIDKAKVEVAGRDFDLPNVPRDSEGFVDWLYLDAQVRVTRGNRGSLFIHVRE